jgi:hypothetical protein
MEALQVRLFGVGCAVCCVVTVCLPRCVCWGGGGGLLGMMGKSGGGKQLVLATVEALLVC